MRQYSVLPYPSSYGVGSLALASLRVRHGDAGKKVSGFLKVAERVFMFLLKHSDVVASEHGDEKRQCN